MANQMQLTTTRFVIRKSLIGKNVVITFIDKHGIKIEYNHDDVYNKHKERFESINSSSIIGFNDSFLSISLHLLLWLINKSRSFLIFSLSPNSFCNSFAVNNIVESGVPNE